MINIMTRKQQVNVCTVKGNAILNSIVREGLSEGNRDLDEEGAAMGHLGEEHSNNRKQQHKGPEMGECLKGLRHTGRSLWPEQCCAWHQYCKESWKHEKGPIMNQCCQKRGDKIMWSRGGSEGLTKGKPITGTKHRNQSDNNSNN